MMKRIIILLLLPLLLFCKRGETKKAEGEKDMVIRQPAVAGMWYPAGRDTLFEFVEGFLAQAHPKDVVGSIRAIISPHAGFVFSGPVAAYGYKLLENQKASYRGKTFVIMGPSHYIAFSGVSVFAEGAYRTPLGDIPIDEERAHKIIDSSPLIDYKPSMHKKEHSIESQLPFLQVALGSDFKIVPVLFGSAGMQEIEAVYKAILPFANDTDVIFIASSDLSHYHTYNECNRKDSLLAEILESGDIDRMLRSLESREVEMCGYTAVLALMKLAASAGWNNPVVLDRANSGDVQYGDSSRVVGYLSAVYTAGNGDNKKETGKPFLNITDKQKEYLLNLARRSISYYLKTGEMISIEPPEDKILKKELAVFVTLNKKGQLRGCIGQMVAQEALYKAVIDMSVSAATHDYRFPPVKLEELDDINIEISILTPLEPVSSWEDIVLGRDGVYIRKGYRSGVFLPQVADETGWTKEEFLSQLCYQKAGLPPDCYKDPDIEIHTFRVVKFHEKE
ncbi:MAG: hypothetical protein B6D65_05330 [candidate division Zixibacteria bacterium 4484_93]|nr:MAG: hypothetical protein B6D65_05330 [candidate division Zixibacteria bacterium 4484_93]